MATILLQSAGAFVGSFFGPVGSAIGSAAGAMAGYMIDSRIISSFQHYEGARMSGMRPLEAEEGGTIPRLYGSARLAGTLIWATRFEERKTETRQGFKGGPKVTEYNYFANVAFALCEGEISFVRRVWADGREVNLRRVDMRVHKGGPDQMPDPLIEAKQGEGNTPAYRGIAYVVFERLPLEDYGNRIPQFQFEVVRACGGPGEALRAVTLIPGATEFGLHPERVRRKIRKGKYEIINRHILHGDSDVLASLDELQALCPNLRHVSVVVPWFGDDLRAGHCTIRPGVTEAQLQGMSHQWSVAGLTRADAKLMSRVDGAAAYGGTPDDASLKALIAELKARGLKVTLYPFVMMDIPAGNGLPDPWGAGEQALYPWRGRITASVAPGRPGSPDGTPAIAAEIAGFLGNTAAATGHAIPGLPDWTASANEWGYRRLVLHYAALAAKAGGVDAFLIGSELRALTSLRDGAEGFPFVAALRHLAREVRVVLGPDAKLTYGADWSEYFGYHPAGDSGDVHYNLDSLWADEAIDAVGIENYMPLADWRDGDWKAGSPDGAQSPWDQQALRAAIAGGEGFDWYYASEADRRDRIRTPVTDGAHGKPWVYRCKDLQSWWENPHMERRGGVETGVQSPWVPGSKPLWFTEIGCPAIDKGANQPNVFFDPKSSESAAPHFSATTRDDLAQRRFMEAHLEHWSDAAANPVSPVTGVQMVDPDRLYWWAWDARPYPAFPLNLQTWRDAGNWLLGHWLNGRLESASLGAVIADMVRQSGAGQPDTSGVNAMAQGVLMDRASTARDVLEQLTRLFAIEVHEEAGGLVFRSVRRAGTPAEVTERVLEPGEAALQIRLADPDGLPDGAVVAFPGTVAHGEVYRIVALDEGVTARIEAERLCLDVPAAGSAALTATDFWVPGGTGAPEVLFLDLPMTPWTGAAEDGLRVAAWAEPWNRQIIEASPEESGFVQRSIVDAPATIGVLTSALAPGHSGVLERHAAFDVSLAGGELASVSDLQLLNWANGAAVLSDAGVWEILQFRDAQEIAPGTWRLSGLLRGQFGTTDAMASGAAAGASFVLINDRVIAAGLRAGEAGLTLNWRVRPADAGTSAEDAETVRLTGGLRAAMPLAPVHLQARRLADGSVRFSWVRCTRVDGDNWLGSDVPLGEEAEAYLVEIRNEQDNGILHSANTAQPSFVWPSGQVSAARDAGAAQCTATIRQQGRSGPGLPAMHRFALA